MITPVLAVIGLPAYVAVSAALALFGFALLKVRRPSEA